jgi:Kdo2-lipid IVA lauroyltransferase/acyltransferase
VHTETRRWWSHYLHPRFWPTWLMFLLLWLLTRLPFSLQMRCGRSVGRIARRVARRRRHIAGVNIRLCFPHLDAREQAALVKAHFLSLGQGVVETALCWWGRESQLRRKYLLIGEEHLIEARSRGNGVILLSAHFTTLELGGRLLAFVQPFHVLYRQHKNPLFEAVMQRARRRRFETAIPRSDTRTLLKELRNNHAVWYAPDQNHGGDHSVFAPFFGIQASTLTTTSRLAKLSGAAVVPFFQMRLPGDQGYMLALCKALENFPGEDAASDAARINQLIEDVIKEMPEQYLWVHRRFKTRPPGDPSPYNL